MNQNSDFSDLLKKFNDCKVRYLIAGAYAVMYHAEPRFTKGLDIWVEPTPENAKQVWKALDEFGAPLEQIKLADFYNKELIYQIGVAPNRIDILMNVPGLVFDSAWKHRIKSFYGNIPINILSLDDIIIAKQHADRDQDRLDLKNLFYAKQKLKR